MSAVLEFVRPASAPACARVRAAGHRSGWLVLAATFLGTVGASAQATAARPGGRSYVVQVGAFSTPDSADALVRRLRDGGEPAYVRLARSGGGDVYRVRVPAGARLAAARSRARDLERRYAVPTWVAPAAAGEVPAASRPGPAGKPGGGAPVVKARSGPGSASRTVAAPGSRAPPAGPAAALWLTIEGLTGALRELEGPPAPLPLFSSACGSPDGLPSDSAALTAEAAALARDPGLDIEAGYRDGYSDPIFDEGVDGGYVGLAWDVLGSGLLENRKRAGILEIRAELARLEVEGRRIDALHRCRVVSAERVFAPLRARLLELKVSLLRDLQPLVERSYLQGSAYLEDYLEIEEDLRAAGDQLRRLQASTPAAPAAGTGPPPIDRFPPILDLALDDLLARVRSDGRLAAERMLREREIRGRAAAEDGTRLQLFLRFGAATLQGEGDAMAAGVRFTRPLFQHLAAGVEERLEAERRRWRHEQARRESELQGTYGRYRAQMDRTIRAHYHFLRNQERVRRSLAEWRVDPAAAEPATAVERMLGLVDAAIDRADALAELYGVAAQVLQDAELPFDTASARRLALPDLDYRGRSGARSLYVWSESFNRYGNEFLLELARSKSVTRVVLSAGRSTEPRKLDAFLRLAQADSIAVELLLGANAWVLRSDHGPVLERIRELRLPGGGLHLDIEPHVLPEFDSDPDLYLERYVSLVAAARGELGPGVSLSLSVPLSWPPELYRRLEGLADRIYLMAYGQPDPERLAERIGRAVDGLPPDRLVLALRAGDFANEWELERTFAAVGAATGIGRFAIHDLDGFLELLAEEP